MAWHEQQECIEELYRHGHLDDVFGDGDTAEDDDLDKLAEMGFTVKRGGEAL